MSLSGTCASTDLWIKSRALLSVWDHFGAPQTSVFSCLSIPCCCDPLWWAHHFLPIHFLWVSRKSSVRSANLRRPLARLHWPATSDKGCYSFFKNRGSFLLEDLGDSVIRKGAFVSFGNSWIHISRTATGEQISVPVNCHHTAYVFHSGFQIQQTRQWVKKTENIQKSSS